MSRDERTLHNAQNTCWNCPAADLVGNIDFTACGQSLGKIKENQTGEMVCECRRRPELGHFEPSITFEQCPEWQPTQFGYMLRDMKVMILGLDGYLGWTLALKLAKLGCQVSGIDNFTRRDCVMEKGAHTVVPIERMTERLIAAEEALGLELNFRQMDIRDLHNLREFMEEVRPEAIVHYAEIPSAPYSMVDAEHAVETQHNNTLGTLGLLWVMKDVVPESSLIKLGTMGEYGSPLTGRPLFEGVFPSDAVLRWDDREWSLGGEITPRDPVSFYHCSKVQDTFNVYEACKYWWLRSYDVMQGVIYGVHTPEVAADERLRTRLDIDEWFGTVVNRFVAQAILGIPLTVYGEGHQIRGLIALGDAMECMTRLICSPPEPGQYAVVNQVSGLHKICELADTVARVGQRYGCDVTIQRVENPRVEAEEHPLEVVSRALPGTFGFHPQVSLEQEITEMFELLTRPDIVSRIKMKKHTVLPRTRWSGEKRESDVLEVYEPGTRDAGAYEGRLVVSDSASVSAAVESALRGGEEGSDAE